MTPPAATTVLFERHLAFHRRQQRLRLAQGPCLTPELTWSAFWEQVNAALRSCGYRRSTRRQYRHILRAIHAAGIQRPADMAASSVRDYIHGLTESGASWSWIAQNIAVVRTVFDRLCGAGVTTGLVTPSRGFRLPEVLSKAEATRIVQAGKTIRDQLLVGLLYGCGLTAGEACRLRWRDVIDSGKQLHIEASTRYLERIVNVPEPFRQLLQTGAQTCESDEYIFTGRSHGAHLSTRMVELIVRRTCQRAEISRPVCVMTLRHSYAVYRLERGVSLAELQKELGHASIRTTERYLSCLTPKLENHPFSKVRKLMGLPNAGSVPPSAPDPGTAPLAGLTSIDVSRLRLPFDPPEGVNPAVAFLRLVKSRVLGGLLKRPTANSP